MRHPDDHIFDHTPDSLRAWFADRGRPGFRADQVLRWVYGRGEIDPAQMTDLSAADRDLLRSEMRFLSGSTVATQRATDGTRKLLVEWYGGEAGGDAAARSLPVFGADGAAAGDPSRQTECVMIPAAGTWTDREAAPPPGEGDAERGRERRTACISSQIGCPVGCRFCASGLGGLDGNLSAGRIVEQVWRLRRLLADESSWDDPAARITNVVFMGMGEPLANFGNVVHAVRTIAAPWGMGIGARKITISTVGLPRAIERLADELELPVTLALSLHAPNDEIRRQLIPWAQYTTIADLLGACRKWFDKTGREITLEYTLLRDVNDRPGHAAELARVAKTLRANVNLIRYNEVEGLPFKRPRGDDVRVFQETLRGAGVKSHIRASRGRDIAAACGQLRHEKARVG